MWFSSSINNNLNYFKGIFVPLCLVVCEDDSGCWEGIRWRCSVRWEWSTKCHPGTIYHWVAGRPWTDWHKTWMKEQLAVSKISAHKECCVKPDEKDTALNLPLSTFYAPCNSPCCIIFLLILSLEFVHFNFLLLVFKYFIYFFKSSPYPFITLLAVQMNLLMCNV